MIEFVEIITFLYVCLDIILENSSFTPKGASSPGSEIENDYYVC